MHVQQRRNHLESIQGITVFGGMYFGIQNAEFGLVKVAANAREQIRLVGCVHHELQAFTQGRQTCFHRHTCCHILGLGQSQRTG